MTVKNLTEPSKTEHCYSFTPKEKLIQSHIDLASSFMHVLMKPSKLRIHSLCHIKIDVYTLYINIALASNELDEVFSC